MLRRLRALCAQTLLCKLFTNYFLYHVQTLTGGWRLLFRTHCVQVFFNVKHFRMYNFFPKQHVIAPRYYPGFFSWQLQARNALDCGDCYYFQSKTAVLLLLNSADVIKVPILQAAFSCNNTSLEK